MNTTVQKWGNSLALRIPSAVAKDIALTKGSAVQILVKDGSMIVKPAKKFKPSLTNLVRGITKSNCHSESDWGAPAGREIW